jgi:hypothetical protein
MIFIVATKHPENDATISGLIKAKFPTDSYEIGRGQWLVSFSGTSKELYDHLFPDDAVALPKVGGLLILGTTGYWGRSPTDTWEWLANKSGAKGG